MWNFTIIIMVVLIAFFFAVFIGMVYSLINAKRSEYLKYFDSSPPEVLYRECVKSFLVSEGYKIIDEKITKRYVTAIIDRKNEILLLVVIVKCEYVYDEDIENAMSDSNFNEKLNTKESKEINNIVLCTNSFYRGTKNYYVMINRKYLLRSYNTIPEKRRK